jgi:hypothetical protein
MAGDANELLAPYAHDQPEYARAFGAFLTHTDQKKKTIGWLTDFVNGLQSHRVFVDAGAGEGSTTGVLAKLFGRTIGCRATRTPSCCCGADDKWRFLQRREDCGGWWE